jgi:uncharacterized protein YndB with AHSA1/START domain
MAELENLGTFERDGDAVGLRYERHYPRPIETVWAALTDPVRLGDWIGAARVEPYVGGRYELFVERRRPMTGRILTWDPPRLLEFSWDTGDAPESIVRCELTPEGDGTRLRFFHKGVGFPWIGLVLPGWHSLLECLRSLLAGKVLPDSMPCWRELQAIYLDRYKLDGVMMDPPPGHCG